MFRRIAVFTILAVLSTALQPLVVVAKNKAFDKSAPRGVRLDARQQAPFDPLWKFINHFAKKAGRKMTTKTFSENLHATGPANMVFHPLSQKFYYNPKLAIPGNKLETLVAGWEVSENYQIALKYYQMGTGRISRLNVEREFLRTGQNNAEAILFQGAGGDGRYTIIAGGTTVPEGAPSSIAYGAQSRVFRVNNQTKRPQLMPDLPLPRIAPMVTRVGRMTVVAGGYGKDRNGAPLESDVMIFRERAGQSEDGRVAGEWLSAEAIEALYPGLSKLPNPRVGGKLVYAEDLRIDACGQVKRDGYLVAVGGSSRSNGRVVVMDPTRKVDIYDMQKRKWTSTEMENLRMYPGVDVMHTPQGPTVVIAGGGTGATMGRSSSGRDPMVNGVSLLNLRSMKWSQGASAPDQAAVMTQHRNGSPTEWQRWAGSTLALLNQASYTQIKQFYLTHYKVDISKLELVSVDGSIKKLDFESKSSSLIETVEKCIVVRQLRSAAAAYTGFNTAHVGFLRGLATELDQQLLAAEGR